MKGQSVSRNPMTQRCSKKDAAMQERPGSVVMAAPGVEKGRSQSDPRRCEIPSPGCRAHPATSFASVVLGRRDPGDREGTLRLAHTLQPAAGDQHQHFRHHQELPRAVPAGLARSWLCTTRVPAACQNRPPAPRKGE